jgi:ubiquinone/menaquinone biosynthesis C-methylase UbiE
MPTNDAAKPASSSHIYTGERESRATETSFLEKRLEINKKFASADFDSWLFERLALRPGEDVLDVGCGTGAQTLPFSEMVGPGGSVSAFDISASSIDLLRSRVSPNARVQAVASDMAAIGDIIAHTFDVKRYDLAHSSYALYYSPKRLDVLDVMRRALKPGGRCAVFTPAAPHGLVELASRFTAVPEAVHESLSFGEQVLKPYFDANFPRVAVHHFNNVITLPTSELLLDFYRQTTYHDSAAEPAMRAAAEAEIERSGHFSYQKNGYLIIGYNT